MYSLFDFVYYLLFGGVAAVRSIGMTAGTALGRSLGYHESVEDGGPTIKPGSPNCPIRQGRLIRLAELFDKGK